MAKSRLIFCLKCGRLVARNARDQLERVKAEKIDLLEKAGLNWREIPIAVDELPVMAEDWGPRLHGIRSPAREELTAKLDAAGMIAPRRQPITAW